VDATVETPVLLVHGLLATPALLRPLGRHLAPRATFEVPLPFLVLSDVRTMARQLEARVERVRQQTGAERVDVVGTSQGGVLALWWALHRGGFGRVRKLVLVASPVRGTPGALLGVPLFGLVSRGIWQLVPGSPLLTELTRPLPAGADVTTVSLTGDPLCPPHRCRVDGARNDVLAARWTPLTHQWAVLSPAVGRRVAEALA
jgi:triacylglycerol lipase